MSDLPLEPIPTLTVAEVAQEYSGRLAAFFEDLTPEKPRDTQQYCAEYSGLIFRDMCLRLLETKEFAEMVLKYIPPTPEPTPPTGGGA